MTQDMTPEDQALLAEINQDAATLKADAAAIRDQAAKNARLAALIEEIAGIGLSIGASVATSQVPGSGAVVAPVKDALTWLLHQEIERQAKR